VEWKLYKFRWVFGPDSRRGAEHSLRGREYPSELFFVAYNTKYKSPEEATEHDDGIMVYSYLLKVEKEDNPVFEALIDGAMKLKGLDAYLVHTTLSNLGDDIESSTHYMYEGSFTSPPCGSKIMWAIFAEPLGISERQLEILRSMTSTSGSKVPCDVQRPVQPLNGRKVYLVTKGSHGKSEYARGIDAHDLDRDDEWVSFDDHDRFGSWDEEFESSSKFSQPKRRLVTSGSRFGGNNFRHSLGDSDVFGHSDFSARLRPEYDFNVHDYPSHGNVLGQRVLGHGDFGGKLRKGRFHDSGSARHQVIVPARHEYDLVDAHHDSVLDWDLLGHHDAYYHDYSDRYNHDLYDNSLINQKFMYY